MLYNVVFIGGYGEYFSCDCRCGSTWNSLRPIYGRQLGQCLVWVPQNCETFALLAILLKYYKIMCKEMSLKNINHEYKIVSVYSLYYWVALIGQIHNNLFLVKCLAKLWGVLKKIINKGLGQTFTRKRLRFFFVSLAELNASEHYFCLVQEYSHPLHYSDLNKKSINIICYTLSGRAACYNFISGPVRLCGHWEWPHHFPSQLWEWSCYSASIETEGFFVRF